MSRLSFLIVFASFSSYIQAQDYKIAIFHEEQLINEWRHKIEKSEEYNLLKKYAYQLGESKVEKYNKQLTRWLDGNICYSMTQQQKVENYLLFLRDEILFFEELSTSILDSFLINYEHLVMKKINQEVLKIQEEYHFSLILKKKQIAYYDSMRVQDLTFMLREQLADLTIPVPNKELEQLKLFDKPSLTFTEFDTLNSLENDKDDLGQVIKKKRKKRNQ